MGGVETLLSMRRGEQQKNPLACFKHV